MDITRPFIPLAPPKKRMIELEQQTPPTRKKIWRYLIVVVVLGLAVNIFLPKIADLQNAWGVVRGFAWWAVLLAFLAEVGAYLGYGYCLRSIVAIHNYDISVTKGALISLGSYSIGMVAGGWVSATAAMFGFMRKENINRATATMAGILPALLINIAIELVAILGIIYLLIIRQLTNAQLIQYSIFLILLTLVSVAIFAAVRFPKLAFNITNSVLWRYSRIKKKTYDPANTQAMVTSFLNAWKGLSDGRWVKPFLGGVMYIGFDMLCLYFMFAAAGYPVNPGVLFAGYGLPLLLSKIAFIFPGGIGVIEASMAALFTSLGVPNEIGVVVIIAYRLFSFWIPLVLGFLASAILSRGNKRVAT
ncbi:MAG: YbhN family protein [Anaerolineaceae bacterium]